MPDSPDAIPAPRRSFLDDLQLLIVILLGVVGYIVSLVSGVGR